MIILILFIILNVVTFGYSWICWRRLSNNIETAKSISHLINNKYLIDNKTKIGKVWSFLLLLLSIKDFISNNKKLIWIPIFILVVINLLLALIIGGIIMLISLFI